MKAETFFDVLKSPYVVIYDTGNGNTIYKTSCSYVKEENFNLKVIENREQNEYYNMLGSYEDLNDATVLPCKKCNPQYNG